MEFVLCGRFSPLLGTDGLPAKPAPRVPGRVGGRAPRLGPFPCSCLTLPDKQELRLKSPVVRKQARPQWKHSFVFSGVTPSQLRQACLELCVWDQAVLGVRDRLLGRARLSSSKSVGPSPAQGTGAPSVLTWAPFKDRPCSHDGRRLPWLWSCPACHERRELSPALRAAQQHSQVFQQFKSDLGSAQETKITGLQTGWYRLRFCS